MYLRGGSRVSSRRFSRIAVFALAMAATTAMAQSEPPLESEAASSLEAASKLFGLQGKGCSSCHTIGQGNKQGPDLKGVTERRTKAWVERFVRATSTVNDETAQALRQQFGGSMVEQNLSDAEFESLWAYWQHCGTRAEACIPYDGPRWGTEAKAEEIALGKALFRGAKPLQNGGPSCLGCHNVRGASLWGGGAVGPDLTFAYAQYGEEGLVPALEEMSSPVMKALYQKAPLTEEEQYQIKAYLADVARDGTKPKPAEKSILYLGLEGMGLLLGLALILLNRKRGTP